MRLAASNQGIALGEVASRPGVALGVVAALSLVPLLPFLGAAFSVDAPVFLAVARQILAEPADPYGFQMIWDPLSSHVARFNHNPPLVPYYLSVWIAGWGEREVVLHAAMLVFPLLAALSFAGIARRWCGDALGPTTWLVWSPAFLVLATTLQLDVPMLAFQLCAVYALLRAASDPRGPARWAWGAGLAAAAAGLAKYPGCATAPLLAAGVVLWPGAPPPARAVRAATALRAVGLPVVVWTAWGLATRALYGEVHFAGGLGLVAQKSFQPDAFWNHTSSVPIYFGAALVFPIAVWCTQLRRAAWGTELAAFGLVAGAAAAAFALPDGEPTRRAELGIGMSAWAALGFAGACLVWGRTLRPSGWWPSAEGRFCALWLGGQLVFSLFVDWHVSAADALLAAPPALLLWFRDAGARPSRAVGIAVAAASGGLGLALVAADVEQRNVYREVAPRLASEIGEQPGTRWLVGHWGFQYYLEREGFRAVVPAQLEDELGRSELAPGDWLATARNVSQLDVGRSLRRDALRRVGGWRRAARTPLRVMNPDAGAGFYSHRLGYVPYGLGAAPLEQIELGRVVGR